MDSNVLSVANEILRFDDFNLYLYLNYLQQYNKNLMKQVFSYILEQSKDKDTTFYKYFDAFFSLELDEINISKKTYSILTNKYGEERITDYFINLLEISENSEELKNKYKIIYSNINFDNDYGFCDDSVMNYLTSLSNRILSSDEEKKCFYTMDKCRKNIKIASFDDIDTIVFKNFDKAVNSITNEKQLKIFNKIKDNLPIEDKVKFENIYPKLKNYFKNHDVLPNKNIDTYNDSYFNKQLSEVYEFYKNRHLLIECNLKLVVSIAKKFKSPTLTILDFIQEGNMGLMRAIKKFDISKGSRLSTYSIYWIKQYIKRSVSEQERIIRIPVHTEEKMYKINNTIKFWEITYGYTPNDEEIANYLKTSVEDVVFVKNSFNNSALLSLDANINNDDDDATSLQDFVAEENCDVAAHIIDKELHDICMTALECLSDREKFVIMHRFGIEQNSSKTLEEVGEMLHLTRERIRQIENSAIRKLKAPARRKLFDGYY